MPKKDKKAKRGRLFLADASDVLYFRHLTALELAREVVMLKGGNAGAPGAVTPDVERAVEDAEDKASAEMSRLLCEDLAQASILGRP